MSPFVADSSLYFPSIIQQREVWNNSTETDAHVLMCLRLEQSAHHLHRQHDCIACLHSVSKVGVFEDFTQEPNFKSFHFGNHFVFTWKLQDNVPPCCHYVTLYYCSWFQSASSQSDSIRPLFEHICASVDAETVFIHAFQPEVSAI